MTVPVTRVRPEDFAWSAAAGPASVVRRVAAAAEAADGRDPLDEAARLTLAGGLGDAVLLLGGRDHEGFAHLHGAGSLELELAVDPAARGRGVGEALARAALEPAGDRTVAAWSHGNHPAAARLAARLGFRPVRELWLMRRPLDSVPDLPLPDGVAVRAFRPGRDEGAFLALNAEAFAWHPEQGRLDRRGLEERMALEWFDPDGFLLAERDGALAGFHWTKAHPGFGEVYVIAVAPGAQGTGLGRALLAAGLAHLRARGLREVVLYVEADNAAAVRLYENEGFGHAPADTDVRYERPGPPRDV